MGELLVIFMRTLFFHAFLVHCVQNTDETGPHLEINYRNEGGALYVAAIPIRSRLSNPLPTGGQISGEVVECEAYLTRLTG